MIIVYVPYWHRYFDEIDKILGDRPATRPVTLLDTSSSSATSQMHSLSDVGDELEDGDQDEDQDEKDNDEEDSQQGM